MDAAERLILKEALARLEALDQEIILLHLWEGLSFEAIGVVLGSPRNTVLSRYARAIQRMREYFEAPRPAGSRAASARRQEVRC